MSSEDIGEVRFSLQPLQAVVVQEGLGGQASVGIALCEVLPQARLGASLTRVKSREEGSHAAASGRRELPMDPLWFGEETAEILTINSPIPTSSCSRASESFSCLSCPRNDCTCQEMKCKPAPELDESWASEPA